MLAEDILLAADRRQHLEDNLELVGMEEYHRDIVFDRQLGLANIENNHK